MPDPPSWDLLDEDCSNISDWVDADNGGGASSVDPAGQFKMAVAGAGAGYYAHRHRDIGSYPDTFTVEVKLYYDALGTQANTDYFVLACRQGDEMLFLIFESGGLQIYDTGSGYTEVGTNLVKYGASKEWQTWRFLVTFGTVGDGVCDVYLNDSTHDWEKVGTAIPCSYQGTFTDGYTQIIQYGYVTANMMAHVDYFKIATGLYAPTVFVPQVIIIS